MICNECETVAHCLKNGCVPKQPSKDEALKLALEALDTASHGLYKATPPAHPALKPLTDEEIWNNDKIMELNASTGLYMDELVGIARAIEAAHGIKENT